MSEPSVKASSVALGSLYFAVFLDMFGGLMVMPLLPFVALDMHASPFQLGLMTALFSFAQIIGSVSMGFVSDKIGRRIVLLACLATTGVTLILFGLARNFIQLLLFRILDGFFSGTVGTAQAMIADLVQPEERSGAMAKCGAVMGLGLILGPGIGGLLAPLGFAGVCLTAAGVTFCNFLIGLFSLPKVTVAKEAIEDVVHPEAEASQETLKSVLWNEPVILFLYACNFLFMTGMGIFFGINTIFLHEFYGITGKQVGIIFMIAGVTMAFLQAVVTKRVVVCAGEKFAILLGIVSRIAGFLFTAYVFNPCVPWVLPVIVVGGSAFFMPCVATMVTNHSPEQKRGAILGIHQSVGSAGNFVGPLMGGALYTVEPHLAYKIGAVLNVVTLAIAFYSLPVDAPETVVEKDSSVENNASLEKDASLGEALIKTGQRFSRRPSALELIHCEASFALPLATSNADTGGDMWGVFPRQDLSHRKKFGRSFTTLETVAEMPPEQSIRRMRTLA